MVMALPAILLLGDAMFDTIMDYNEIGGCLLVSLAAILATSFSSSELLAFRHPVLKDKGS
jgi:hydrogenase-4 membrane subunit HyfE